MSIETKFSLLALFTGVFFAVGLYLADDYRECMESSKVYPLRWSVKKGCEIMLTHNIWVPRDSVKVYK